MFNFWWLAGLFNELEPHLPPLSSQKNKMLVFELCSTSDDWLGCSIDLNPVCHPSPVKKMKCLFLDYVQLLVIGQAGQWTRTPSATPLQPKKLFAHFWIMFNFWWSAGLVNGLKPHLPPLSSQKKIKCLFLDYVQLLMISRAGQWTRSPSATPLQPKNKMLVFGLCSTFDDQPGWSVDSKSLCYPSPAKKIKCLFLDYVQFLMISQAVQWTRTPSATPLQPKK